MRHRYAHLSDAALLRELATRIARDRATTADLVALIAEVDARRLFVAAGHSSMHAYCVDELHLSDDEAYKRITAARTARRFPTLFMELAEGRLHMTAVCTLAPHLTEENVGELVHAATHRRRSEIEDFLDAKFPARITAPAGSATTDWATMGQGTLLPELAPERVGGSGPHLPGESGEIEPLGSQPASEEVGIGGPARVEIEGPARVGAGSAARVGAGGAALAPERVVTPQLQVAQRPVERMVQVMIRTSTHERLCYAQALLSHAVPSGDVSTVIDRALELLISKTERRKLGSGNKTRVRRIDVSTEPSPSTSVASEPVDAQTAGAFQLRRVRASAVRTRYIPARVRRAVWERDQGRCTFLGPKGNRCTSKRFLEFDHVNPYARGGRPTVEGLRLRCSAHNQFEALRVFGAEFISRKRRERRAARKAFLSRKGNAHGVPERNDHPDP